MKLIPVDRPELMDQFIRLPFRLYKDDPKWVPPLISAEQKMMDPRRNPFYDHSDAAHFLVEHEGRMAGRISAIDNPVVREQPSKFSVAVTKRASEAHDGE